LRQQRCSPNFPNAQKHSKPTNIFGFLASAGWLWQGRESTKQSRLAGFGIQLPTLSHCLSPVSGTGGLRHLHLPLHHAPEHHAQGWQPATWRPGPWLARSCERHKGPSSRTVCACPAKGVLGRTWPCASGLVWCASLLSSPPSTLETPRHGTSSLAEFPLRPFSPPFLPPRVEATRRRASPATTATGTRRAAGGTARTARRRRTNSR
jgi:hypothetical protein